MHARQALREAFADRLSGLQTTGDSVFQSRTKDLETCWLPCLLIYSTEEMSKPASLGHPRRFNRQLKMVIEGVGETADDLDDLLDQMAEEIETAIGGDPTFCRQCKGAYLNETKIGLSTAGKRRVGVVRLEYIVNYSTFEDKPGELK